MSQIVPFPRAVPRLAPPPRPLTLAQRRRFAESDAQAMARIPTAAQLAPYYGAVDSTSAMTPFAAYAELDPCGYTSSLHMPHGELYLLDHPKEAQDLISWAFLSSSVITEAHWSGALGNEPWAELSDPPGYARAGLLNALTRLREAGCDVRLLERMPLTYRAQRHPAVRDLSRLELFFEARRRLDLARP
jgi:hypothetical protein